MMKIRFPFLLSAFFLLLSGPVHGAAGDRDASFGTDGVVVRDLSGAVDSVTDIALQGDGKVVLTEIFGNLYLNSESGISRFLADGELDASFDGGGFVTLDTPANEALNAVLPTAGGLLAAGTQDNDFLFLRLLENGDPDPAFGTGGIVTLPSSAVSSLQVYGLALQEDGKIVVTGSLDEELLVGRFNADGTFDEDFGTAGLAIEALGSGFDSGYAVAIQEDEKILVAGDTFNGADDDLVLLRYLPDGSLDPDFADAGKKVTPVLDYYDSVNSIAVQPDGKILLAGSSSSGGSNVLTVLRYSADGALDTMFDGDGIATAGIAGNIGTESGRLALQADGKILIGGTTFITDLVSDFALVRLNADGSLDTTFHGDGRTTTDVGGNDSFAAIALRPDGRVILAGRNGDDAVLIQYLGNTADLKVSKEAGEASVSAGNKVEFTVTVTNDGPESSGGVQLIDTLPSGLALDVSSVSVTKGSCVGTSILTCDLNTLNSGEKTTVRYSVTANEAGSLANSASVSGQAVDPSSDNNTASVTVEVSAGGGCSLIR